jgi:PAS domain-containing protein
MTQPRPRRLPRGGECTAASGPSAAPGVVLLDTRGRVLVASEQAARLLDADGPDALTGRPTLFEGGNAIHPDGAAFPAETHPVQVALRTGEAQAEILLGVLRPGNEPRWFRIGVEPLFKVGSARPYAAVARFVSAAGPSAGELERLQGNATRVTGNPNRSHRHRHAA